MGWRLLIMCVVAWLVLRSSWVRLPDAVYCAWIDLGVRACEKSIT